MGENVGGSAASRPAAAPERMSRWMDFARHRPQPGDLFGGLAAMAVALPQAMGLGIALFTSVGLSVSGGALAGLLSAAALCLASGLMGATIGMISAPNGPVFIMLAGSLATYAAAGLHGADLTMVLAAIVVLAGVTQIVMGITGAGQLIKYVPHPVVTGLVSAVGILMITSQMSALAGGPHGWTNLMHAFGLMMIGAQDAAMPGDPSGLAETAWLLIPAVTAIVTILGIQMIPRFAPRIPGIVGGFVVGTVVFYVLTAVQPGPIQASWMVGQIPGLDSLALDVSVPGLLGLPWPSIVVSAVALAVVASIDCLVTAVVADVATGNRHDARRELIAQGIGQIVSGGLGGCGGGGTKGSTLTAIHAGGRRWPAVVAGLTFILVTLFFRDLGRFLPISVLAGVIIHVGFLMIDWRVLTWVRARKTRVDGVLALAVVAAMVVFDVVTGVGVGAISAAVLFIRRQSLAPVIHERATGRERRSLRHRDKRERKLLEEHGDRILYVELRGHLFFGTVDRLFTELLPDLQRPVWIIVNMRRVQSLDMSGVNLLRQMAVLINANGGRLLFANLFREAAPDRKMNKLMRMLDPTDRGLKAKTFKSTDQALEFAEDQLLAQVSGEQPPAAVDERVETENNELCKAMKSKSKAALRKILTPLSLPAKSRVFSAGDESNALYLVLQGEVDVRLPIDKYHYKRLKRVGPGGFFGELNFLNPGPSVTTATVARDAELMVLDAPDDKALGDSQVREAVQGLRLELGNDLAERMRWASVEISRLERW